MKKFLMILTNITAIGIGTIVNTINSTESIKIDKKEETLANYYLVSTDITKHDIEENGNTDVFLNDLLTLFKELQKVHTEKNTEVKLYGIPVWALFSDDDLFLGQGWINNSAFINLYGLINSDYVDFKDVTIYISSGEIIAYLNYKIADANLMLELFSYKGNIPLKQDKMTTYFELHYETVEKIK